MHIRKVRRSNKDTGTDAATATSNLIVYGTTEYLGEYRTVRVLITAGRFIMSIMAGAPELAGGNEAMNPQLPTQG